MPAAAAALLLGSLMTSASLPSCAPAGAAQLQGVGVEGDALDRLAQQQQQQPNQQQQAVGAPPPAGAQAAGSSAAAAPAAAAAAGAAGEGDALDAMMR